MTEIDTTGYKPASERAKLPAKHQQRWIAFARFGITWLIVLVAGAILQSKVLEYDILHDGGGFFLLTFAAAAAITLGVCLLIASRLNKGPASLTAGRWIVATVVAIPLAGILHLASHILLIYFLLYCIP